MEVGKNIKHYRNALSLSQDDLADKVYVSRQTISNWENDKSYPDIHSLMLLCTIFGISLDQLIKGDLTAMKEHINELDQKKYSHISTLFILLFVLAIITPFPLLHYLGVFGGITWGVLMLVLIIVTYVVEKYKKRFDMQTYREILAFTEGRHLNELEKAQEKGKRPYQKILYALVTAIITTLINMALYFILR